MYRENERCIEKMKEYSAQYAKSIALMARNAIEAPDAKKAVLKKLRDPDSAKFGEFTLVDDNYACLTVNARNSYGGYTGDKQASLAKYNYIEWSVLGFDEISHEYCIDVLKRLSSEKKKSAK